MVTKRSGTPHEALCESTPATAPSDRTGTSDVRYMPSRARISCSSRGRAALRSQRSLSSASRSKSQAPSSAGLWTDVGGAVSLTVVGGHHPVEITIFYESERGEA
jgi:hypothetical protein